MEEKRELKAGQLYRHFKGGLYRALMRPGIQRPQSLSLSIRMSPTGGIWVRDKKMFLEKLDKEKYVGCDQTYRFEEVDMEG